MIIIAGVELIHHHFETLPSTNDWAKKNLSLFDPRHLTVVTANHQTEGRGQFGRRWISPPLLNLCVSFCFFIELDIEPYSMTYLLAMTASSLLSPLPCRIKWPNDLMVNEKKIAGILCETETCQNRQGIVLGMGLNVNIASKDLAAIDQPATSLLQETGYKQDIETLQSGLIFAFLKNLALFHQKGMNPFESTIQSLLTN